MGEDFSTLNLERCLVLMPTGKPGIFVFACEIVQGVRLMSEWRSEGQWDRRMRRRRRGKSRQLHFSQTAVCIPAVAYPDLRAPSIVKFNSNPVIRSTAEVVNALMLPMSVHPSFLRVYIVWKMCILHNDIFIFNVNHAVDSKIIKTYFLLLFIQTHSIIQWAWAREAQF